MCVQTHIWYILKIWSDVLFGTLPSISSFCYTVAVRVPVRGIYISKTKWRNTRERTKRYTAPNLQDISDVRLNTHCIVLLVQIMNPGSFFHLPRFYAYDPYGSLAYISTSYCFTYTSQKYMSCVFYHAQISSKWFIYRPMWFLYHWRKI